MTERTLRMLCKELAAADWDSGQHSDRYRKMWPDVRQFVGRNWPAYAATAKEIMVAMLTDKNTSQSVKDGIYDALVDENTRNANRKGVSVGRGHLNLNPNHPGRFGFRLR